VKVASSHNSYLSGTQHLSFASSSSVIEVLQAGARCIELDIFGTTDGTPVVGHGINLQERDIMTTTTILLEDVLHDIANFQTTDPIFLCLELNTRDNHSINDNIADLLMVTLGPRLIYDTLNHIYLKKNISTMPLRTLLGKVVLMCGGGSTGILTDMMDIIWGKSYIKNNGDNVSTYNTSSNTSLSNIPTAHTAIGRVYPAGNLAGALSLNINMEVFLDSKRVTFVALNYQNITKSIANRPSFIAHM
jgi:hypothetical protein